VGLPPDARVDTCANSASQIAAPLVPMGVPEAFLEAPAIPTGVPKSPTEPPSALVEPPRAATQATQVTHASVRRGQGLPQQHRQV
jgi:hypothetical protein